MAPLYSPTKDKNVNCFIPPPLIYIYPLDNNCNIAVKRNSGSKNKSLSVLVKSYGETHLPNNPSLHHSLPLILSLVTVLSDDPRRSSIKRSPRGTVTARG